MDIHDIFDICSNDVSLLAFLQYKLLIKDEKICDNCLKHCEIRKKKEKFYFKCNTKYCASYYSVTTENYFLYNIKITYTNALLLIYYFVTEVNVTSTSIHLRLSKKTVVDWFNFCREVCILYSLNNSEKIGGVGKIVEIDESVFGKRKFHRGRFVHGQWVIGGVERGVSKYFLVPISNRNSETISKVIQEHVEPGTTIITDCWKGYNQLSKLHFDHLTVNHSITFKDKITGAHTNSIEGTWAQVKYQIPSRGRVKQHLIGYLSTFIWFKKFKKEDRFEHFLEEISKHYH